MASKDNGTDEEEDDDDDESEGRVNEDKPLSRVLGARETATDEPLELGRDEETEDDGRDADTDEDDDANDDDDE